MIVLGTPIFLCLITGNGWITPSSKHLSKWFLITFWLYTKCWGFQHEQVLHSMQQQTHHSHFLQSNLTVMCFFVVFINIIVLEVILYFGAM